MKKGKTRILSGVLTACILGTTLFGSAGVAYADGGEAQVTIDQNSITIGNDYLQRNYTISGGHVLTSSIDNKRIPLTTVPGPGSEDFVINTLSEGSVVTDDPIVNDPVYEYKTSPVSNEGWSATLTNGSQAAFPDEQVKLLFDDQLNTHVDRYDLAGGPFTLDVDFGTELTLAAMSVNKRPGYEDPAYGVNGTMGGYEIWTSTDGKDYTLFTQGAFTEEDYNLHQEGELYNVGDMVYVNFDTPIETRYIRVVQTSAALGTADEFTSAEIAFHSQPVEKVQKVEVPTQVLDRSSWSATLTNGSQAAFPDEQVKLLFDDQLNTHVDRYDLAGGPFTLDINLGSPQTVSSLSIDKRPGFTDANFGLNGTMGEFELYVSDNGSDWELAGAGKFTQDAYNLHDADGLHNVGDRVYANFYKTYTTQYVRLVQKSCSLGTADEFSTAEVNLYSDQYVGPNWNLPITPVNESAIYSSDLEYAGATQENTQDGVKLTIHYAPYNLNGVTYTIAQVVVMDDADHYMRSFLEISVDNPDAARIDYIDTDRFIIPDDAQGVWSRPEDSQISSMWIGQHELMLGQPIYLNGLFMGCEFPAEDTIIQDNATQIRYYSGKNFTKLQEDGQLTTDGKFVTWQNVIGAAQGTDTSVVQTDFFSYISDIATPTDFRKQYNSWYDNMMSITDESIASSFNGAEAGLTQNGVEPLDSYVVDDGWNNYYSVIGDHTYVGPSTDAGSGTPNQTGFWEFNNKFPNELYTSSELAKNLGATFGVWVGPQGGYNYFGGFAQYLEAMGTGEAQGNSVLGTVICTGSRTYLKNFQKMALDFQNRFNVEYWKWDGFASRPCDNPNHNHMTGGDHNMYFTSDMWEAWTDLFDAVRANNPDLFINATCYVNLSPWLLQWVNTIWVQDSGDTGQLETGAQADADRHQQKIYYRDQVYYKLLKQNQVQFPLSNIYNHDPIYGVSDQSNATTQVFREYLLANAVRGTAFWELYYSPSIMDEDKWQVTADVLDWTETNFHILRNAKYFGNDPQLGVYGYSSWDGEQGIISFTNPLNTAQTYQLTVDDTVGAVKTLSNATGIQVEPYVAGQLPDTLSYGDTLTVELEPYQTKILQFNGDNTQPLEVVSTEMADNNTLRVKFSQRVNQDASFTVNGTAPASATLMADYRTVELTMDKPVAGEEVTVKAQGLTNAYGTPYQGGDISFATYTDNLVADLSGLESTGMDGQTGNPSYALNGQPVTLTQKGVAGTGVFTAAFSLATQSTNAVILDQDGAFTISIDKDGYLQVTIGQETFTSQNQVTTVTQKANGTFGTDQYVPTQTQTQTLGKVNDGDLHSIAVVREANGMLKIYLDGSLCASHYNEANLNEALTAAPIVLGSTQLQGTTCGLQVIKTALDYTEVEQLSASITPETRRELDRTGWTATACSEMPYTTADANAQAAIDGNLNSWWHSNYQGEDPCAGAPHWIAIDFGGEITFDSIDYTGRGGSNGDVSLLNLYALNQNDQWELVKENVVFDENKAVNTITLDRPLTTAGIKFELLDTVGGFGAAKEIQLFTSNTQASAADVEAAYLAAKAQFDTVVAKDYTQSSYNAYAQAFANLSGLWDVAQNNGIVMQFALDDAVKAVNDTYAGLVKNTGTPTQPDGSQDSSDSSDSSGSQSSSAQTTQTAQTGSSSRPTTGDRQNLQVYLAICLVSLVLLWVTFRIRRRSQD